MSEGALFKVENIAEMKNFATRMSDRTAEMNEVKAKAMSSLSNLQGNIVCDGSEETLTSLSDAIEKNTSAVNSLFEQISGFINEQMVRYEEANATAKSGMENIEGQIGTINVN